TSDGYIWLATLDGLVRHDGVRFVVFNKNNSKGIVTNRFTQLVIDAHGDLWIGTEDGNGIMRYHNGEFETYSAGNSTKEPIWRLTLNAEGDAIVYTESGIFRWNGEKFVPSAPIAGETKESLALWGKSGAFWYTRGQTVFRYKDGHTEEYHLPFRNRSANIQNLFEDKKGRLWIGTNNDGLFQLFNGQIKAFTTRDGLPDNHVSPSAEDTEGNLWAGTDKGAVIISPDGGIKVIDTTNGLSDNVISRIFLDREGNIWIGTYYRGLNRLSRQSVSFYSLKDGLQAEIVHPIYEDRQGNIWIGGKSLTRFSAGRFFPVPGRESFASDVTAIEQDSSGRLWFGNWETVYYLENGKFHDFGNRYGIRASFTAIHQDRSGAIWFATSNGLYRLKNGELSHLTDSDGLPSNDLKVIYEAPDGTLWIGAFGGLAKIENCQGELTACRIKTFTAADGLSSNLVRSLYLENDGTVWIGSYDGGLTRLKDGKFTRYTSNDGLFNDGVFQILEDEQGNFWMSSNRGIYRVAKQQLIDFAEGKINRIESIAYGKADGLIETECNGGQQPAGIKASDGKLWFPTQRGVAVIDPSKILTNPIPPPVVIESVRVDNQEIKQNMDSDSLPSISIAPDKNNLEITYTGLSFIKPEFVKFRYRLEGQDADWVEAGTRRAAYYSYLPAGEYIFHVTAANSDGVWNTQGTSLKIKILPPFYRTNWFWILCTAVVFGTAFAFYRARVLRLERARKQQEEFSRKLLASQEQERQRIAAELHDSIGQSLLIIKNRAFLALSELESKETVKEQLEELSNSAAGAIEECREISYNLRPYQIDRFGLTRTLEAIFRRISEISDIKIEIKADSIDGIFSGEAETSIYRIVQESVNNIIKHSQARNAILSIKRSSDRVEIIIKDDGRGFAVNFSKDGKNSERSGFGLIGMAERARMIGAIYSIDSHPDIGTVIRLRIPLQNKL
ncbi:MAG TPA: two-component regulator propeller domain-containing protein, partial [Pyrinomonadaceae bacterium]|nr:two-component regulator propeller domain-containing protein [Pyrinomonadaceae bacterium]